MTEAVKVNQEKRLTLLIKRNGTFDIKLLDPGESGADASDIAAQTQEITPTGENESPKPGEQTACPVGDNGEDQSPETVESSEQPIMEPTAGSKLLRAVLESLKEKIIERVQTQIQLKLY